MRRLRLVSGHPVCREAGAAEARGVRAPATLGRLRRKLLRKVGRAVADHAMIEPGDRILVATSGGKDSYTLLDLLGAMRARAPIPFELVAVVVDSSFGGYRTDVVASFLASEGHAHRIEKVDIGGILRARRRPDTLDCVLCSRLRRGVLYRVAREIGCTKIALGHHRDDLVETLLLNAFFNGRLKSMAPKLRADDGVNVVIRPLCYVAEEDAREYATLRRFPIVCCRCPACTEGPEGLVARDQQRQVVKGLLGEMEKRHPRIRESLLASLGKVDGRHLMDPAWSAAKSTDHGVGRKRPVPL